MTCQTAHAIDYSSPHLRIDGKLACQNEIARFVYGVRGQRTVPVTKRQITKWFRATPAEFVEDQIDKACMAGKIRIVAMRLSSHRRSNGAYGYVVETNSKAGE